MLSLTGFSDFARHYFRNLGWCLFLELLRCFSSPGSPRIPMYSVCDTFRWVSPFRNLRIKAYLPAPRSLSQAITSFVAYHCQGIHHMLLFTWPYNFDVCYNTKVYFQGMFWLVFHQSRYAVNFTELSLFLFTWKFKLIWIFMWRNQKIVASGTVCTYLYELVQFPLTTLIRLYEFLKNSRIN